MDDRMEVSTSLVPLSLTKQCKKKQKKKKIKKQSSADNHYLGSDSLKELKLGITETLNHCH